MCCTYINGQTVGGERRSVLFVSRMLNRLGRFQNGNEACGWKEVGKTTHALVDMMTNMYIVFPNTF